MAAGIAIALGLPALGLYLSAALPPPPAPARQGESAGTALPRDGEQAAAPNTTLGALRPTEAPADQREPSVATQRAERESRARAAAVEPPAARAPALAQPPRSSLLVPAARHASKEPHEQIEGLPHNPY